MKRTWTARLNRWFSGRDTFTITAFLDRETDRSIEVIITGPNHAQRLGQELLRWADEQLGRIPR